MNRALATIASVLRGLGIRIGQPRTSSASERGSDESDRTVPGRMNTGAPNAGEKGSGASESTGSDSTVAGDAGVNRPLPHVTSVGWTDEGEVAADLSTWCNATAGAMNALTYGLPFPQHLVEGEPKRGDEFDINDYFTVLRHLSMKSGYVLDYVYNFGGGGGWGHPVLYPRKAAATPYQSFLEFAGGEGVTPGQPMFHKRYSLGGRGSSEEMMDHLLNYVELDGSPESYFELAILDMLGDQFYRFWHSNYYDAELIFTDTARQAVVERLTRNDDSVRKLEPESVAEALQIDLRPRIYREGDAVHVQFIYFTKWGGFYRNHAVIAEQAPHSILTWNAEKLVHYDCGIVF